MNDPLDGLELRPAVDADADGVIALVDLCFREFPGCVLDVEREERGLLAPASSFDAFWVVLEDHMVVGMIACSDHLDSEGRPAIELKKLYLHPQVRGRRLGTRLVQLVEARARGLGARIVELWSDTRFLTAHSVYEHLGYRRTGQERELHDLSATREFHYVKEL